jgi:hypothetical protein
MEKRFYGVIWGGESESVVIFAFRGEVECQNSNLPTNGPFTKSLVLDEKICTIGYSRAENPPPTLFRHIETKGRGQIQISEPMVDFVNLWGQLWGYWILWGLWFFGDWGSKFGKKIY